MRLVLFLNNWGGWQVAKWLRERHEDIVALVIQPENDQRFALEILRELNMPADRLWLGPQLKIPETVSKIRDLSPDLGISAWFGYLLKPELLQVFAHGCINLHPAYLPWNRGWHTNVWPILDGTPAGVTVHYIDAGVDTGDIIAQRRVPIAPTDTGGTLHQKLNAEMIDLFQCTWPLIRERRAPRTPQDHSRATQHRRAELGSMDFIDLEKRYDGRDLLNRIRARTYPPYPAAYYVEKSQKVFVRVHFSEPMDFSHSHSSSRGIDLDRQYSADEFLRLLCADGSQSPPHFVHESKQIFVGVQLLKEKDLDGAGIPLRVGNAR